MTTPRKLWTPKDDATLRRDYPHQRSNCKTTSKAESDLRKVDV